MQNILICDDDKETVEALSIYLKTENFNVYECYSGDDAINIIANNPIDLLIIDIIMPEKDGFETVKEVRNKSTLPIVFLSAKQDDNDKINGLNIGADDYITKPFNPLLLIAKCKALLRHDNAINNNKDSNIYTHNDLYVDDNNKIVMVNNSTIKITPIEYSILLLLIKNKGKIFSTKDIYENVWHTDHTEESNNTIAVHIRRLREKIETDTKSPEHIKVIWGLGYKMEEK